MLPEIVGMVINNVHMVPDLLNCACVNSTWSVAALKKLYKGSLHDMQFRTPDIGSLNCLFVASRERFRRNVRFVKHLLISPEIPAIDEAVLPDKRLVCIEKCRAMRNRQSAELLLRPQGEGIASLTIPFEIEDQDWSPISDLLLPRTIELLAIDDCYCELLMASSYFSQELVTSADRFVNLKALTIYRSSSFQDIDQLCRLLQSCDLEFFHLEAPNGDPRPRLKMLSLGVGDQHWLEQIPKFEELQILCLDKFAPEVHTISQTAIQNIAKCQYLRVVDIAFPELNHAEALLDLACGCPLLQKIRLVEDLCISLLRALPRLEHFELDMRFRLDGAVLQDLARHCSQLTVLALPRARLSLSHTLLTAAHPFQRLEIMHFAEIFFESPRRSMQRDKLRGIATEWRRVFPKLRVMPCQTDVYSSYLQEDDSNEDSEGDSILGYPVIHDKVEYMWHKNLEIEITGWPVVPLMAFSDPDTHSTTAHCYRQLEA
ncbi:hypothetical protein BKA61DRAFT_628151 [Leptodontidium sp. MPI-SDFR-AT-0119]|nr:hypothetical protein BKA61DRAFT_628151 [Leptodontidium sp. MPI-SDFR-AT-0119]